MTQKPYQRYKESGIDWIGKVPEHWEVKPVYSVATIRNGYPFKSELFKSEGVKSDRLIRIRDIAGDDESIFTEEACPDSAIISNGDVLIGMDGDFNVHRWMRGPAKLNQRMCAVSGRTEDVTQFLSRCLPIPLRVINDLAYATTVKHLSSYEVLHTRIAVPPTHELANINGVLDRETSRIDTLISEKERLIILLQEYRQALISRAVTKGLDPKVKMKDPGVEWLGEVPEHWEVKKLKNISPQITVGIVVEPSKYYVDNGVPALRSLNISSGSIIKENFVFISNEANETLSKSRLNLGDLVVVRSGQPGTTAVIPKELDGCNCIDLIIIRKPIDVSENYLSLFMNSDLAKLQVTFGIGGAIQQHFNVGMAQNIVIPLPPQSEQTSIASFLDQETSRIDTLISEARKFIDLLKEYRSSLITAAVTGKIDLREVVSSGSEKREIAHE